MDWIIITMQGMEMEYLYWIHVYCILKQEETI